MIQRGQAPVKPGRCRARPRSVQDNPLGSRTIDIVATAGDQATALIVLGSIVIPLALLTALCWFFWKHRQDD
jgi:hypothetical protein